MSAVVDRVQLYWEACTARVLELGAFLLAHPVESVAALVVAVTVIRLLEMFVDLRGR